LLVSGRMNVRAHVAHAKPKHTRSPAVGPRTDTVRPSPTQIRPGEGRDNLILRLDAVGTRCQDTRLIPYNLLTCHRATSGLRFKGRRFAFVPERSQFAK